MSRQFLLGLLGIALAACASPEPLDGGVSDTGVEEPVDARSTDASAPDVPPSDVPRDVSSADTPRDVSSADTPDGGASSAGVDPAVVEAILEMMCGLPAYAACTVPWGCGCENGGLPPPADLAGCIATVRSECDALYGPRLFLATQLEGARLDPAALDDCFALWRRSYDLCLPQPVTAEDLPARCWDALLLDLPIDEFEFCGFLGARCAGGAGICDGYVCLPAEAELGASCVGTCEVGAACVGGVCAAPVAPGGACSDHEDCAPPELCVGGRCGPLVTAGGACTGPDLCETGLVCEAGTCRPAGSGRCVVGDADVCPSRTECRSVARSVCLPRRALGEACWVDSECADGLTCFQGTSPPRCARLPDAGEPCSTLCAEGLVCITGGTLLGTCETWRTRDEPCGSRGVPVGASCEPGLACVEGVCAVPPGLGGSCVEDARCEEGLVCGFDDWICQLPALVGASCEGGNRCEEGTFCAGEKGARTCLLPTIAGAECSTLDAPCGLGLECRFVPDLVRSLCVLPPMLGEPCDTACAGAAFCAPDPSATACVAPICDQVTRPVF